MCPGEAAAIGRLVGLCLTREGHEDLRWDPEDPVCSGIGCENGLRLCCRPGCTVNGVRGQVEGAGMTLAGARTRRPRPGRSAQCGRFPTVMEEDNCTEHPGGPHRRLGVRDPAGPTACGSPLTGYRASGRCKAKNLSDRRRITASATEAAPGNQLGIGAACGYIRPTACSTPTTVPASPG